MVRPRSSYGFFFLYALYPYLDRDRARPRFTAAFGFPMGLASILGLLGYFNWIRYGSVVETGRTVDPNAAARFGYGVFTSPMEGLYGLLLSSNKGLLLFCPAVLLGAVAWPLLHRRHRFLSCVLAAAVVFRIVFIATRSDWHGGFCLGPRYLLMVVPYLCLPLTLAIQDLLASGARREYAMASAGWLLACQQFYFSLGEVISDYFRHMWQAAAAGANIFAANRIYFDWNDGPLTDLLDGARGPLLLRQVPVGNYTLFLLGCGVLALLTALVVRWSRPAE